MARDKNTNLPAVIEIAGSAVPASCSCNAAESPPQIFVPEVAFTPRARHSTNDADETLRMDCGRDEFMEDADCVNGCRTDRVDCHAARFGRGRVFDLLGVREAVRSAGGVGAMALRRDAGLSGRHGSVCGYDPCGGSFAVGPRVGVAHGRHALGNPGRCRSERLTGPPRKQDSLSFSANLLLRRHLAKL